MTCRFDLCTQASVERRISLNTLLRNHQEGANKMHVEELPPDNFGVHVADDMDRRRLLWLVNEIGVEKLLKSVAKYTERNPGSEPYVSRLLKWHRKRVPTAVYMPEPVPVNCVYLLALRDHSAMKVGYSGDFLGRAYQFLPTRYTVAEIFDLELSVSFETGHRRLAKDLETLCKRESLEHQVRAPTIKRWGDFGIRSLAGGEKEWRSFEVFAQLRDRLSADPSVTRIVTLQDAILEFGKATDIGFDGTVCGADDAMH